MLIGMCDEEEALLQSTQPSLSGQDACSEYSEIASIPILELSAEEERMLARAVLEKQFQIVGDPLPSVSERR